MEESHHIRTNEIVTSSCNLNFGKHCKDELEVQLNRFENSKIEENRPIVHTFTIGS